MHLIVAHTVKAVYNNHPRDPKIVFVVDRLLLFSDTFTYAIIFEIKRDWKCWLL